MGLSLSFCTEKCCSAQPDNDDSELISSEQRELPLCATDEEWKQLSDTYSIIRKLGTGSFGTVYVATHKISKERYAVKEIMKSKLTKARHVKCLQKEISIMKSLRHPNIVKLFEVVEERDRLYLVLELLEGGDLFDRIVQRTLYTEQNARDLMLILFRSVKYLHDQCIVHR
jgi:serine/threonine protein kinase